MLLEAVPPQRLISMGLLRRPSHMHPFKLEGMIPLGAASFWARGASGNPALSSPSRRCVHYTPQTLRLQPSSKQD